MNGELKAVALGLDAEAFIQSGLGKAFLDAMQESAISAMNELKAIKPSDFPHLEAFAQRVQDLQNEIYRAESMEQWLVEVVETGRNMEENLRQQEAAERP
jgi:hypothetical protein